MNKSNQLESEASLAGMRSEEGTFNSDPSQIKYKKAVREISKLINLVKALRNQINTLEAELDEAHGSNSILQQKIKELQDTAKTKYLEVNAVPEKAAHEKQLQNTGSISEYLDAKKRAEQLEHLLAQKQNLVHELQSLLEKKHNENVELYEKCELAEQQLGELKAQKQQKKYPESSLEKQLLHNELKKSQDYIRFLTDQCNKLKQQQIKQKIIPNIPSISSQEFAPRGFMSPKLLWGHKQEDLKKAHELKNELKHKKQKYRKEIKVLKEDVQFYKNKYQNLIEFVEKQQRFIQKCILGSSNQNNFGQGGNFNYFNNHSAFTQNQEEHDVYKL